MSQRSLDRTDPGAPHVADVPTTTAESAVPAPRSALGRFLDPSSPALTYAGVLAMAVGFVLIAIAWADTAGQADVYRQLPYLVSAGFTGLALVIVGALTANVAAKRQDGVARDLQVQALVDTVAELRRQLEAGG